MTAPSLQALVMPFAMTGLVFLAAFASACQGKAADATVHPRVPGVRR